MLCCAVGILSFAGTPVAPASTPCLDNLRQIEVAKHQWFLKHSKSDPMALTWSDLRPYLPARLTNGVPVCPQGGAYTIGRLDEAPRCSLGDKEPGHKLP